MNKEQTKQAMHEVLWNYLDHSHASEEEWNETLNEIYISLKEKGVIK